MRIVDLSDTFELTPETLIEFFQTHPLIENLSLCPMPSKCLKLFSSATMTAFNQPDFYLGFVKKDWEKINKGKNNKLDSDSKATQRQSADLQSIINTFESLKYLKELSIGWVGSIAYRHHYIKN